jgi:hypothetical protein
MKTKLLMPEEVTMHWELLRPEIIRSLDHSFDETSLSTHLSKVLNYQSQLWVFYDGDIWSDSLKGVGLTQFLQYSNYRTLHIITCSGYDWAVWADQYYVVEQFAKDNKCKAVESWGRKGWARALPKAIPGFEEAYVVMRKELGKETI